MDKLEQAKQRVAERQRAKIDRLFLAREVLGYDFTEETHAELFDQFPQFDEEKSWAEQFPKRDVLILWSRGHYKTTAVIVIVIQAILVNPDIRVILMQGSKENTKNLLSEIASHFNGEALNSRLAELFPEFCGERRDIKQTVGAFTVPARKRKQLPQPTCVVASPKSLKTGQHYDLGIFDDLINDQNYRNPKLLVKAQEDFDMCYPLIDPGCPRFVTGTRYAFGDLYEEIMKRDAGRNEWFISVRTCWKEEDNPESGPRFPQQKSKDGRRTIGFTKESLLKIMHENPTVYATQYLNKVMLESQQRITESMLNAALILPSTAPLLGDAEMVIDLAVTDTEFSDDCVICVGRRDQQGKGYVVSQRGGVWSAQVFAHNIIDEALKLRKNGIYLRKIWFEKSGAGLMFVEYLKGVAQQLRINLPPLEGIKVDNRPDAKNRRVEALAGQIKARRFHFFLGLPNWDKAKEQAISFPKGRHGHDDYPDTWALMAQKFNEAYLFMTPNPINLTRHSVIAMMDRDPVAGFDAMGQEELCRDGVGVMGDFSC